MSPSTITISSKTYVNNLSLLKKQWHPSIKLCAVVKADAYGHGLHTLAPFAVENGTAYLGITENHEAQAIRDMGITAPIIRLRPALQQEIEEVIHLQIDEIVGSFNSACLISEVAKSQNETVPIHIKIDTGISRMGFHLPEQYEELQKSISQPGFQLKGVMTHFPNADNDDAVTIQQEKHFWEQLRDLDIPIDDVIIHTSNSAASISLQQHKNTMVRVGIASFGLRPSVHNAIPDGINPVLSWKVKIVQVRDVPAGNTIGYGMTYTTKRDSKIATLPIGYANGYLRTLSNNADVLVQGKRCPVVGRVSMNMVTVDVTGLEHIEIGDEVVLVGRQGEESITLEELADRAGTINYELACLIGMCNARDRVVVD